MYRYSVFSVFSAFRAFNYLIYSNLIEFLIEFTGVILVYSGVFRFCIASQSASPEGCSCVTRFCFGGWFEGGTVWAVLSHGHCKTQPDERLPGLLPKNKK